MRITSLAAFMLLSLATLSASAEPLGIGDPAPPLGISKWVKGERFDKLEPNQTYVVEFWATWCGPCRATIPHLTELQKKYKDKGIKFIGVSVWEQDQAKIEPFVKEMGDKMDYSVAVDDVPEGKDGNAGKMATAWMKAAEADSIPTAFIVKNQKVAWIGHPMQLDIPLAQVAEGKYDIDAAASKYRENKALDKKLAALTPKITPLFRAKKLMEVVAVLDEAIADEPKLESKLFSTKFTILSQVGHEDEANAYAGKYIEKATIDDAQMLNTIAWNIVDPDSKKDTAKRDLKLAMKAANKANDLLKGEDAAVLDTLALVCFESGEVEKAVQLQEKAAKLMPTDNDDIKSRLEKYKKALKDKEKN